MITLPDIYKKSLWRGMRRLDFERDGHAAILVLPDEPLPGNPWVWRTEFFDAFAQVDEAMARAGYCVAYVRLSDRYGCPSAVADMYAFYRYALLQLRLSPRPHLFGFSRGGLYAGNYALAHPEATGALYLDAPVLDIRGWPLGLFSRGPSEPERAQCLNAYGLTPEQARVYEDSPLRRAADFAKDGTRLALVAGDADEAVPIDEHSRPFARAFEAAGGELLYIEKPGVGHHPHSLDDPTPVVRFLTRGN